MSVARLLGPIRNREIIARGRGIQILGFLVRTHGGRNWRKVKGNAYIRDEDGQEYDAEIHWFEAHGVGKVRVRVKHRLD